jgi:hypothetical protein
MEMPEAHFTMVPPCAALCADSRQLPESCLSYCLLDRVTRPDMLLQDHVRHIYIFEMRVVAPTPEYLHGILFTNSPVEFLFVTMISLYVAVLLSAGLSAAAAPGRRANNPDVLAERGIFGGVSPVADDWDKGNCGKRGDVIFARGTFDEP